MSVVRDGEDEDEDERVLMVKGISLMGGTEGMEWN